MIEEIKIPDIGERVESIQVVGILTAVGDTVKVDQGVIEVETNKAAVEIPSTVQGKVVEILVEEGDEIKIGQVVAKIEVTEGSEETDADTEPVDKKEETKKDEKVSKKKKPEKIAPATEDIESDKPAKVQAEKKKPAKVEVADEATGGEKKEPTEKPQARKASSESPSTAKIAPASPSVRRLARELGVDINEIEGTGPGGRISDDDVKDYVKDNMKSSGFSLPSPHSASSLPDFSKWGEISREPMSLLRTTVAKSMTLAWQAVPQVTQFDEADITEMERFRKKYGPQIKDAGGKLTITAILIKVLTAALQRFPRFNATIDVENKEIIHKKYINIAVAVDTDRGLVVPVLKNVDRKNIHELSVELTDIADRTRDRKVKPEELEGGTFTISNQGGIGGTNFTPIVYWPQVAILGVSRSRSHLEHIEGRTEPRVILPLALSYDHRLIDGADAARFLSWVVDALEHPLLLNLEN